MTLKIWIRSLSAVCIASAALALLSACDRVERAKEFQDHQAMTQDKSHVQLVSRDAAELMGAKAYTQMLNEFSSKGVLDEDKKLTGAVQDLAVRLVAQATRMYPHTRDWDWDLHVVTKDEMNAFCIAGGKMVVYTGLLQGVDYQEDKIAAVLGHEISHALLEHTRTDMTREWLLSSGLWIASKSFKMGLARSTELGKDLNMAFIPIQRQHERDADALGLELMARAGFDPGAGSQIWMDMQKMHGQAGLGAKRLNAFYSDHPMDEERLATLTRLAQKWQSAHPAQGALQ